MDTWNGTMIESNQGYEGGWNDTVIESNQGWEDGHVEWYYD